MTYHKGLNTLKNNSVFNILEYMFVIMTILQYSSVYVVEINGPYNFLFKSSWCILLFILLLISLFHIKYISRDFISFFMILSIFTLIIVVISFINYRIDYQLILTYFLIPICLALFLYILSENHIINSIFDKYVNITLILSIISLFFWILSIMKFPTNMTELVHWGSNSFSNGDSLIQRIPGYFFIHFIAQGNVKFLGLYMVRNTGIFMEAPIYSVILDMALLIHLFLQKKRVFDYKTCILLITLFSTTSTNGLLIAVPSLFCAYCINKTAKNKGNDSLKFAVIPIIFILTIIILYVLLHEKSNLGEVSSSSIRLDDISATTKAWLQHIFIGNGVGNDHFVIKYMAFWRFLGNGSNLSVSVGFTKALAYGGILLGIYYIFPLIMSFLTSYNIFIFSLFIFILFVLDGIDVFPMFKIIIIYIYIRYIYKIEHVRLRSIKN